MAIPEQRRPSESLPLDIGAAVLGAVLFDRQSGLPLPNLSDERELTDVLRWVSDYTGQTEAELQPHIPGIIDLVEEQRQKQDN